LRSLRNRHHSILLGYYVFGVVEPVQSPCEVEHAGTQMRVDASLAVVPRRRAPRAPSPRLLAIAHRLERPVFAGLSVLLLAVFALQFVPATGKHGFEWSLTIAGTSILAAVLALFFGLACWVVTWSPRRYLLAAVLVLTVLVAVEFRRIDSRFILGTILAATVILTFCNARGARRVGMAHLPMTVAGCLVALAAFVLFAFAADDIENAPFLGNELVRPAGYADVQSPDGSWTAGVWQEIIHDEGPGAFVVLVDHDVLGLLHQERTAWQGAAAPGRLSWSDGRTLDIDGKTYPVLAPSGRTE
jgi:hypothetical protein